MANSDLGEVLALIGFLAAIAAVVAIVWIARGFDTSTQWAAVAALAASVQAVAVAVGLVYAWRQIQTTRDLDEMRRRREIVDRIADIAFVELIPLFQEIASAVQGMRMHYQWYHGQPGSDVSSELHEQMREEHYAPNFKKHRDDAVLAARSARAVAGQIRRLYISIGLDGRVAAIRAEFETLIAVILSDDIERDWPNGLTPERFRAAAKELDEDVVELIRSARLPPSMTSP